MSSKLEYEGFVAELNDAMRWECEDPEVETLLNTLSPYRGTDGFYYIPDKASWWVIQTAENFGGSVIIDDSPSGPELLDVDY